MCSWFFIAPSLILAYVSFLFIIAQYKKDNSIVDIGWGGGIMFLAVVSFILNFSFDVRKIVITTLILLWGIRLTYHIGSRHKAEDPRYKKIRESWGDYAAVNAFIYIFLLQGFLMMLIAYPAVLTNSVVFVPPMGLLSVFAVILWCIGFGLEVLADYQLQTFLSNPDNKGKICNAGLWRYSRHPNYFGETCMWWAIFLLALPVTYGWTAIISPLTITGIFLCFTIDITERQFAYNAAYQEYKKKTSRFFPWLPKVN